MGAVNFSIDQKLIKILKNHLPLSVFIETGTFQGGTIEIVKNNFDTIYSIELSQQLYEQSVERFKNESKINLINADSANALTAILSKLQHESLLFWLDAHWCIANNTAGQTSQCPLLGELDAIKHLNENSVIIIDDARLFLAAPTNPHEISQWPSFHSIINKLFNLSSKHQLAVVNDCIIYFPAHIEKPMHQYANNYGVDWLDIFNKSKLADTYLQLAVEKEEQIQILVDRHKKTLTQRIRHTLNRMRLRRY